MVTAGNLIDMVNKIVKKHDLFVTYSCDNSGVLTIKAFGREIARYFGNGDIWIFFNNPNPETGVKEVPRFVQIKHHLFNSFRVYREICKSTYQEREQNRIKTKAQVMYSTQKFDGFSAEQGK